MQKLLIVKIISIAVLFCFMSPLHGQQNLQNDQSLTFHQLKQQLVTQKDDLKKDTLFQQLIRGYIWYKPDSALFFAREKVLLAKKLKAPHLEAFSMGYYGYISGLIGNYPQALNFLLKGLRIAETQKENQNLDFFYDALSDTYTELNDFERALFYAHKFRDISLHENDTLLYGWLLTTGVAYERFNQPDSALVYLQKAYEVEMQKFGRITRGRTLLTLGNIYLKKGNAALSLPYFHMAVANAAETNHSLNLIEAYNGLARFYITTNQLDSSHHYANAALRLSQSASYALGKLNSYTLLSNLYKKRKNSDSAIQFLEWSNVLKDSLFKEREVQNISFNEQLRQYEIIAAQQQYRNKIRMYSLISGLVLLFVVVAILYRNNQSKQKAYALLQKQKAETERQKTKAEETLEELKAAQAQLIQSEKMASLGELTAGIAHEIQNPLNFVNNFSEVSVELIQELKEEIEKLSTTSDKENMGLIIHDILQNHQKINHHGKRADAIVKGMLQHSRGSTGKKEAIDLNTLADEYLRMSYHGFMARDRLSDVFLKTHFDPNIGKVQVVPQDIGKVLLNLFNNAFYYVTEKKKQQNGDYKPTVSVSTKRNNSNIEVTVWDNGTGIPEKILGKIYQPFFTTKPTGDGTGLGLSLSYDIVTKGHGGEIKVETKEGEYTAFTVLLPV